MDINEIKIRTYQLNDEKAWIQTHAIIMTESKAWNYAIQHKKIYRFPCIELVATYQNQIIGFLDIEVEDTAGRLTSSTNTRGGMVQEFGRLKQFSGMNIGKKLIDEALPRLIKLGINRVEFWSQDESAQEYYQNYPMQEIHEFMRFSFEPDDKIRTQLKEYGIIPDYVYGMCPTNRFNEIKQNLHIFMGPPLEPHLVKGFELIF